MRAISLFLFGICSAVAGCSLLGISTDDVVLRTDLDAYQADATIQLTVENQSSIAYEMGNLGCARLERKSDGQWQPVSPPINYGCTSELVLIPPDSQIQASFALYGGLGSGE